MQNRMETNGQAFQSAIVVKLESTDEVKSINDIRSDILEHMKPNESTLFSNSEDMKPNVCNAFSTFEERKPVETQLFFSCMDIKSNVGMSSLESDYIKQEVLTTTSSIEDELNISPDSTAVIDNFTEFKSELNNELKELKLLHTELNGNVSRNNQITGRELKTYKCDMCCQRFSCKVQITHHVKLYINDVHHQKRNVKQCKKCNTEYILNNSDLSLYNKFESVENSYKCDICHKQFLKKSNLSAHKYIHSGLKPYECDVCHKKYNNRSYLSNHKIIHSEFKPYECDVCYKKFHRNSDLNKHRNSHSKPFACDVCHKKYGKHCHLTRHKNIHTGLRPYECDVCNKTFGQKYNLSVHKKIHSSEKPYECDLSI